MVTKTKSKCYIEHPKQKMFLIPHTHDKDNPMPKADINPVESAIWDVIARYKRYNAITGALDGDEVDTLCDYIKCVINDNEGNT